MNGVHDMGGMDGFGKVEVEPNEPPFHEKWEGRVLGMPRALGYAGAWHIDDGRFAQEALPPRTYLAASYYWRWALGITLAFIVIGLASFAISPINYSVEFTGGHLMDVRFNEAPHVAVGRARPRGLAEG